MLPRRMMALVLAIALIPAALAAKGDEAAEKSARSAADAWLALVDRGEYGESWDAAAAFFKQAISRPQWEETLKKVRGPLGKVNSRKPRSAEYTQSIPNAPAGEYVVIQYGTSFAGAPAPATETVTPMKDKDGVWRVSGYYIR
jgi:hypothetical protein